MTDTLVGPGQHYHDLSDGCVPSHTSHLAACRANVVQLRAEVERLKAAEIWVTDAWIPKSRETELLGEIDVLRIEMHRLAESRRGQRERAERAEAEVERLHAKIHQIMAGQT